MWVDTYIITVTHACSNSWVFLLSNLQFCQRDAPVHPWPSDSRTSYLRTRTHMHIHVKHWIQVCIEVIHENVVMVYTVSTLDKNDSQNSLFWSLINTTPTAPMGLACQFCYNMNKNGYFVFWQCLLKINLSKRSKKQTEIAAFKLPRRLPRRRGDKSGIDSEQDFVCHNCGSL